MDILWSGMKNSVKLKDKTDDFKGMSSFQLTPGCTPGFSGCPSTRKVRHSTGWSAWGSQAESEPTGNSASACVPMICPANSTFR